jgi:hypothetical protein
MSFFQRELANVDGACNGITIVVRWRGLAAKGFGCYVPAGDMPVSPVVRWGPLRKYVRS